MAPHLAVFALRSNIMQQEKVAHALKIEPHAVIILVDISSLDRSCREKLDQICDAFLNKVDRC